MDMLYRRQEDFWQKESNITGVSFAFPDQLGPSMAPVRGLKRSKVWDHFSANGECKYCKKKINNFKIFNLWRHIRATHPEALTNDAQQSINDIHVHVQDVELELYTSGEQPPESPPKLNIDIVRHSPHQLPESPASLASSSWTNSVNSDEDDLQPGELRPSRGQRSKQLTDALLFMIVKDTLSTRFVEGKGFQTFMEMACRKYKIPNRRTVKRLLDEKFALAIVYMKERLSQVTDLAITVEVWPDASSEECLIGFTGHFVQDFQMKSQLLCVKSISENDSSDRIRELIVNMLVEWSFDVDNVVACVADTDCVVTKAIQDTFSHMKVLPCFALQINRLVQAALSYEVNPFIAAVIEKVRLIVIFLKNNSAAAELLNKNQVLAEVTPVKLKLNCPSLWSSCFVMLQRLVEIGEHVVTALLVNKDAPEMLGEHDLIITKEILDLLRPFKAITDEMCREPFTARAKIVPMVYCLKCELSVIQVETDAGITFRNKLIELVSEQFSDVGSVALNGLTTLLDPRYKNVSFEMSGSYDEAVAIFNHELNEVVQQLAITASNGFVSGASSDSDSIWKFHDEKVAHCVMAKVSESDVNVVVTRYLETPTIPRSSDPLVFWHQQQYIHPALSNLATKYSCIPATCIPSDRLFTKAGNTYVRNRSAICESRVEKILMLGSLSYQEWNKLH